MKYRCVASSPEGLVQQVAVCYLRHGYWWYVAGTIPKNKDPEAVDRKLVEKYGIDLSDRQRAYRKKRGLANMQYIRHHNWFLLMATAGHHKFKQDERSQIKDCRRHPIEFNGYSISYRRSTVTPKGGGLPKWHSCVRIDPQTYRELKAYFAEKVNRVTADELITELNALPFARFAPVRRQLLALLKQANDSLAAKNRPRLLTSTLRLRREIEIPFRS